MSYEPEDWVILNIYVNIKECSESAQKQRIVLDNNSLI